MYLNKELWSFIVHNFFYLKNVFLIYYKIKQCLNIFEAIEEPTSASMLKKVNKLLPYFYFKANLRHDQRRN